jgi:hypothetical protein
MSDYTGSGFNASTDFLNSAFPQLYGQGSNNIAQLSNYVDVANNPYVAGMNQQLANMTQATARQNLGDYASTLNEQLGSGMYNLNRGIENQGKAYNRMMGDYSENLMEKILPSISSQFVMDQGFGGSRQALAESEAIEDYQNTMRDMMSDVTQSQGRNYQDLSWGMGNAYGDAARNLQSGISNSQMALAQGIAQQNLGAYGTGVNAQAQATQMLPMLAELGLLPAQTYMNMGNIYEGFQQKGVDEAMNRWDFYQNEPWQRMSNANAIYSGASPYAVSSSSGSNTQQQPLPQSNNWANAAALGMGAYGLFSKF